MSSEFSKRVEDLRKAQQDVSQVPKAKKDYPTGFEPGVKWDEKTKKGTAIKIFIKVLPKLKDFVSESSSGTIKMWILYS